MNEKQVWLEEWRASESGRYVRGPESRALFAWNEGIDPEMSSAERARTTLAAAAPALLRALLLFEWADPEGWGCRACGGVPLAGHPGIHFAACRVNAALTAAGFPDQASRDAARKLMKEASHG